jgi:hypothetical protein
MLAGKATGRHVCGKEWPGALRAEELTERIKLDPMSSTQIMRLANSSSFESGEKIVSPNIETRIYNATELLKA